MSDIGLLELFQLDMPPLLMLMLTAVICGLSGNYIVLVRRSLMGDAVSHSVLPGIVLGFLWGGSLLSGWLVVGALISAMVALLAMEVLYRRVGAEPNASTGAVFTIMFALGVVLLETWVGTRVHLDVEHVLFGSLEQVIWLELRSVESLVDVAVWGSFPSVIVWGFLWLCVLVMGIFLFGNGIVRVCFDGVHASLMGVHSGMVHGLLMMVLTVTAVLSFRAVGSILVIALFVCPPATARLLSESVRMQVWLSVGVSLFVSVMGYSLAVFVPLMGGYGVTFSVAGSVAVLSFVVFVLTAFLRRGGWRTGVRVVL